MSKHTPGPWVFSYDQGSTRDIVSEKEKLTICMVRRSWVSPDAYTANAQLIATSPKLLEALKYARRFLKPADADTAFIDSVIAEAEGEV